MSRANSDVRIGASVDDGSSGRAGFPGAFQQVLYKGTVGVFVRKSEISLDIAPVCLNTNVVIGADDDVIYGRVFEEGSEKIVVVE